jgi:hypothetical protein
MSMSGLSKEEIERRMDPKHLTDLKEEVEEKAGVVAQKRVPDPDEDPKTLRDYNFEFEWKDGRGKVWKGSFISTVPDIRTRTLIGSLQAQLSNNVPVDALEPGVRRMNLIIAHLTFSLTKRPKWAEDVGTLFDPELIQAIYEEVAKHEATFLGYDTAPAGS